MIVVADTTPIRYLVVIEREHLLPALYGGVLIPPAVAAELDHESSPDVVRAWLARPPNWLTGSKSGSPPAPSHLKWIWTEESEKRSPWPRNLQPTALSR